MLLSIALIIHIEKETYSSTLVLYSKLTQTFIQKPHNVYLSETYQEDQQIRSSQDQPFFCTSHNHHGYHFYSQKPLVIAYFSREGGFVPQRLPQLICSKDEDSHTKCSLLMSTPTPISSSKSQRRGSPIQQQAHTGLRPLLQSKFEHKVKLMKHNRYLRKLNKEYPIHSI